jgi:hypothetical protein
MLTDKAKIDFEKWFLEKEKKYDFFNRNNKVLSDDIIEYHSFDFFDEVGIIILIGYNSLISKFYWNIDKLFYGTKPVSTRTEATTQAIIKANEIYNNNQKK